jgi:dTDP-4-dehydrorhamnose 3,5-epimerase-like enzyme
MRSIDGEAGGLDVVDLANDVPFAVARIYWLRDTPTGIERGRHAHARLRQMLVLISGAVTVDLDDGRTTSTQRLSVTNRSLVIEPVTWRVLFDFAEGTVLMVLASEPYDPDDYLHDYATFRATVDAR